MGSESKYTVIELSDKLQVPRTTITDWLVRYAAFIDFKVQGKRKVYTDKSIEVLVEIKGLRDQGLSSFDIEEELAKRHPIHGEFSNAAQGAEQSSGDAPHAEETAGQPGAGTSLVRQAGNTEVAEMLRNMLVEMTRRMDELERQSRLNLERSAKWNMASFATILMLAAVSVFGFLMIRSITEEKEGIDKEKQQYLSLSQSLSNDLKDERTDKKQMEQTLLEIDGDRKLLKGEMQKLQAEMDKQKVEFENVLRNAIRDSEGAKEAEVVKLRDKFAEERLALLKELEKAKEDQRAMSSLLAKFQAQTEEKDATIDKLIEAGNAAPPAKQPEK